MMYEAHFGLTHRPFAPSIDPVAHYPATGFEQCIATLHEGLADGETFLTLTGDPGVGKSLAGRLLVGRLGGAVFVNTAVRDPYGLYQALLFDLGLPHTGRIEAEMRLALVDHLLQRFAGGAKTVLIFDEAHLLNPPTLEELRLLGNLEGAVQIVLLGQPAFVRTLDSAELAALRQRVAVRAVLEPLGVEEAADYVLHHLRVAGAADGLVGPEALELLARVAGGVPRRLNQAMHRALRMAAAAGAEEVEVEAMIEALTGLGLSANTEVMDGGEPEGRDSYPLFAAARRA